MSEPTTPTALSPALSRRVATYLCAAALLLFAVLSYAAVSQKSPTSDEPIHAASAYLHLRYGDFRAEPDHPPLWKYWAALPWVTGPTPDARTDTTEFNNILHDFGATWRWSHQVLYETPSNDPSHLIGLSRAMMLLPAIGLGAITALFAGRAGETVAAAVATVLFCLDPNFLAHAPLVKNDVAVTFFTTALTYAMWRAGQGMTWPRLLALGLCCAGAITTKFTGIFAAPMLAAGLFIRALLPAPWNFPRIGSRIALAGTTRRQRLTGATLATLACALFTYASIWAVYLFRFSPTPTPGQHFDRQTILAVTAQSETRARLDRFDVSPTEMAEWSPGLVVNSALFALDHHLLPESFTEGFLFAYAGSKYRLSYLLGQAFGGASPLYFPVAFLTKTPLATLAALLLLPLAALAVGRSSISACTTSQPNRSWLAICLALPVIFFGLPAVTSSMNIGLRHIFPIYPPLFIATGIAAARLHSHKPRATRNTLLALAALLSIETFFAFPNYIPFFNAAAGGSRGGLRLLSDSNLDWGQDLPALATWQRAHPDRALYLAYFGTADPAYYGIRYHNLRGGYDYGPPMEPLPDRGGVAAISASVLQGVWANPDDTARYADLLKTRRLITVLGGSIYLFDLDAPPAGD